MVQVEVLPPYCATLQPRVLRCVWGVAKVRIEYSWEQTSGPMEFFDNDVNMMMMMMMMIESLSKSRNSSHSIDHSKDM